MLRKAANEKHSEKLLQGAQELLDQLTPTEAADYFGPAARDSFFQFYQQVSRQKCLLEGDTLKFEKLIDPEAVDESNSRPLSARTKFVVSLVAREINPRPGLLLRKHFTTVLNLAHQVKSLALVWSHSSQVSLHTSQSMGDEAALALANSLARLPALESLNLSDNK
jgi:hypothetical protein